MAPSLHVVEPNQIPDLGLKDQGRSSVILYYIFLQTSQDRLLPRLEMDKTLISRYIMFF